jgi:hypothetical protein
MIALFGYLLVLACQALTRTFLTEESTLSTTAKEVFKSLEKFSSRFVNLVLYYIVLELLPIKIILTTSYSVE